MQEDRFTRRKHDARFPEQAIDYCLRQACCTLDQVEAVVFSGQPSEKDRLREALTRYAPAFDAATRLTCVEPHVSHAASAFFPSPFQNSAILTVDGGDGITTSLALGSGNKLDIYRTLCAPHSLASLYSAVTAYLGFKANSGEYKVMGLAPYGEAIYAETILDHVIDVKDDGTFALNPLYFDDRSEPGATAGKFADLFGQPPRPAGKDPLSRFHMDMAASIQAVTNHVMLTLARAIRRETGARNLCLAGEVALNCVANGKIAGEHIFERLWIQPAAGNAGKALGAALAGYHLVHGKERAVSGPLDGMRGSFLGPEYGQDDIENRLQTLGARFSVLDDDALIAAAAAALAEGKAVGWMQGRLEFGPRALGNRSILGDPRAPFMQKRLNIAVKYRENFRPFAPSVLREDLSQWFDLEQDSPYMLLVAPVRKDKRRILSAKEKALTGLEKIDSPRSSIPAVTHVDYSARIQTVHAETNPRFHALIDRFKALTGCGAVVNTSFNVRGEPVVCSPEDAFGCFMGSGIDVLAIGNCLLVKEAQDPSLSRDSRNLFEPD